MGYNVNSHTRLKMPNSGNNNNRPPIYLKYMSKTPVNEEKYEGDSDCRKVDHESALSESIFHRKSGEFKESHLNSIRQNIISNANSSQIQLRQKDLISLEGSMNPFSNSKCTPP